MGTKPRKAKPNPTNQNPTLTDLGIIQVSTLNGIDTVTVTHNKMVLVTVKCGPGRRSSMVRSPDFKKFDTAQLVEMGAVYLNWKRQSMPDFKLELWRGKTTDGHTHPWRFNARKHDSPSPLRATE